MTDHDHDPTAAPAGIPAHLASSHRPADRYGTFESAGTRLRYACWKAVGTSRGTVVVLTGRGEFIEKYATEVVGELLGRGFAVFALDWRGQGLSARSLPDRDKGHVEDFALYLADLGRLLQSIVLVEARRPILALAHSMGGHILLRHLAEAGAGPLTAAVAVSPMTHLYRHGVLQAVLWATPPLPAIDRRYLIGGGPFATEPRGFQDNTVTHDERRFRFTDDWFRADPRLTLGGPTVGWARQALRSMAAARAPGLVERIDVPVLLLSAGQDTIVDPASHGPMAARLRRATHVTLAGARHEILMETDGIRAQFWQAFDRFSAALNV